jgi:hypothetical protein
MLHWVMLGWRVEGCIVLTVARLLENVGGLASRQGHLVLLHPAVRRNRLHLWSGVEWNGVEWSGGEWS